jgi:hypothetical protein
VSSRRQAVADARVQESGMVPETAINLTFD